MRTVQAYSRMLFQFFGIVGKTPDEVTSPDVFSYAHSIGLSGKNSSSVTIAARIACLSSFYRFLIRMSLVASNPCDKLERPRATPAPPRGLGAMDIQKLLAVIPETLVGPRDRAIILTLTLTGRRRSEVLGLTVGDLHPECASVYYTYRGKGGNQGKPELPQPALETIRASLMAFGRDFSTMRPDDSLWPSNNDSGRGISSGTFYGNLRRYLKAAGLPPSGGPHLPSLGGQVTQGRWGVGRGRMPISRSLVTGRATVYLRRLEGDWDTTWQQVAQALGI